MIDPTAEIHPLAVVEDGVDIGARTKVWQFAVVLAGARVGSDCNLNAHVFVEGGAVLGDRVTLKSGVYLWDGIRLEDDVFCGPNATFTNDKSPRSRVRPEGFLETRVGRGASIGAAAVILPGLVIGEDALIGAGSVVTRNIPPKQVWAGNPARPLAR